jgi:hypothetical protein
MFIWAMAINFYLFTIIGILNTHITELLEIMQKINEINYRKPIQNNSKLGILKVDL